MKNSTALVFSEYSAGHDTGSHPENQSRLDAIQQRLSRESMLENRPLYYAEPVEPDIPKQVHDAWIVDRVQEMAEAGGGAIDGDTWVAPGSWLAALAAVGAAVQSVNLVLSGEQRRVFAMARPPGHHAERSRQIGFCLFNNIAIAAHQALQYEGIDRVAILDWDVHHGNGTQDIFYRSSNVFFCSIHQWPLFPGSGLEYETGEGEGAGFTLNLPLPAGAGDAAYLSLFDDVIIPRLRAYQPDLILVSAGFDAHRDDPLAMMAVSEHGFRRMTQRVRELAEELTDGQLVVILEGGYNLRALSESVAAVLGELDTITQSERGHE
jgi:acetoin utilization deacetylase AcuC-like enzyme